MKKQEFLNAVEHEVRMLKKHGTKAELAKLDFETLDPEHTHNCIYGQMTGSCANMRAKDLMDKACVIVFKTDVDEDETFSNIKSKINGKNTGQGWRGQFYGNRNYAHLSALEGYIKLKGSKNMSIIRFLQGKTDKLKL